MDYTEYDVNMTQLEERVTAIEKWIDEMENRFAEARKVMPPRGTLSRDEQEALWAKRD